MNENQYQAIWQNQKLIQILRLHPSLDRIKIAEKMNISSPTLYKTFDELKRNEILNEDNMINPLFGQFVGFSIGTSVCKIVFLHFDFSIYSCEEFAPFRKRFVELLEQKMRELNKNDDENILNNNLDQNNNYIYFQTPPDFNTLKHYFDAICCGLIEFVNRHQLNIISIGVSSTGTIDKLGQTICEAHNLDYLQERPINKIFYPDKNTFFKEQNIGVYLVQNSTAATIAETFDLYKKNGSLDASKKSIATIYLEYGIGAGFVFDGKLFSGASGYAGEIGHVQVSNNILDRITKDKKELEIFGKDKCSCGATACVDHVMRWFVFSVREDEKQTVEEFKKMGSADLCACLKEDQTKARSLGLILGYITNLLSTILNVDLVIFTGKLYRSFGQLEKYIIETLDDNHLKYNRSDCNIQVSTIGTLAPAIGAAINSFYSNFSSDFVWY